MSPSTRRRLARFTRDVDSVEFSPDGRRGVTTAIAESLGSASLWDITDHASTAHCSLATG
jgi:hypothetical protein